MTELKLYFSEAFSELYRIEFNCSLLSAPRISSRGKTNGHYSNGSFQWTNSVKALCLLILKTALEPSDGVLRGFKGSSASSLDFAISKEPEWLLDVLGKDKFGRSLAKRIFQRVNSELKQSGPVEIGFTKLFRSELKVSVFISDKKADSLAIKLLIQKLSDFDGNKIETPQASGLIEDIIKQGYSSEISTMVNVTNIFSTQALNSIFSRLKSSAAMRKVMGSKDFKPKDLGYRFSQNERVGVAKINPIGRKISVEASVTLAGGLAILSQLNSYGYNLDINYKSCHAVDIVNRLLKGLINPLPDLMVLGVAPAATLMASSYGNEYVPLMFLPKTRHGVVQAKENATKNFNSGEFLLMAEEPSLPSFIFDDLMDHGALSSRVKSRHLEPDETFYELGSGNSLSKAILFFPHFNFNLTFNNCSSVSIPEQDSLIQDVVLVAKIAAFSEQELFELDVAIRDIWLGMICNPQKMQTAIDSINNDSNLQEYVMRISGIHRLLSKQGAAIPNLLT